jgi:branched-chain amino acid transport system permease protein
VFYGLARLVNARFGRVLQGIRENEARMEAVGYAVYRYKLVAFVIAAAIAGLGGALLANQNGLASPNMLHWSQSGMLLIMVILGGVGFLYGGALGAAVLLLVEEVLSAYTMHWPLGVGLVLLGVVLFAPNGLAGVLRARRADA